VKIWLPWARHTSSIPHSINLQTILYNTFDGARGKVTIPMVSTIGPYSLGSSIEGLEGLSELSREECAVLPKQFEDEKIYVAPDLEFLGFRWNLMLGVRAGRIYKISPQLVTEDTDEAQRAHTGADKFFSGEVGRPSERNARRVFWRMPGGNVILEQESRGTIHCVQFFVTGGPFKFTLADPAEVAADGRQPKGVGAVRRQNSPWFLNTIAQVFEDAGIEFWSASC
jgi:hypothetical protein